MSCVECNGPVLARGRCAKHYRNAAQRGVIEIRHRGGVTGCKVEGCKAGGLLKRGYCPMHYTRVIKRGTVEDRYPAVCQAEGCDRRGGLVRGMCRKHYARWLRERAAVLEAARSSRLALEAARRPS